MSEEGARMSAPPDPPADWKAVQAKLRGYADTDGVRLALIIRDSGSNTLAWDVLLSEWAARWPRHAVPNIRRGVEFHVRRGLSALRGSGLAELAADGRTVVALAPDKVAIAASNADIVMDRHGLSVPPMHQTRPLAVPEDLVDAQNTMREHRERRRAYRGEPTPHVELLRVLLAQHARPGAGGGIARCQAAAGRAGRAKVTFDSLAAAQNFAAAAGQLFGEKQYAYPCRVATDGHAHVRKPVPKDGQP